MPVERGTENGKPYLRWGSRGTKRFYIKGNERSLQAAKQAVDGDRKRIEFFKRK